MDQSGRGEQQSCDAVVVVGDVVDKPAGLGVSTDDHCTNVSRGEGERGEGDASERREAGAGERREAGAGEREEGGGKVLGGQSSPSANGER